MSDSQRPPNKRSTRSNGANERGEVGLDTTTPSPTPTPIPVPLTSLIGRERDVSEVTSLLHSGQTRLLTLTGPGGVGKTRLALQVAAGSRGAFSDGAYFISLAPINNPGLVLSTIAQTLGVPEAVGQPFLTSLCSALHDKHILLILDNFEQVLSAAPQVLDLLLCAPNLHALITSRTVLHVYGEHEYQVSPLSLPDTQQDLSLDQLNQSEAVRLFIERAQAVKPGFTVNDNDAPAVAEICHRLDGLPLAIELAAARVKLLSPQALLKRLDHTLPFLTQGATSLPYRHQTLRNAIAWSYDLLSDDEKELFRSLSVFVGGCTLEAAQAMCAEAGSEAGGTPPELGIAQEPALRTPQLDDLAALVDKSLLQHEEQEDGEPRFSMLETVREFALEQLAEGGEEQTIRERHARFFLELAERAAPELLGANQLAWLDILAREHDNLRAALLWSQHTEETEVFLRISAALWRFWFVRGYLSEGRRWLSVSLDADREASPALRARALTGAGNLAWAQGDYDAARNYHELGLTLRRKLGDRAGVATSLANLGNVARVQGEHAQSRDYHEQSLAILRELGDKGNEALVLHNLGALFQERGDYEKARRLNEAALTLLRELQDKRNLASVLSSIGEIEAELGDYAAARATLEESLTLWRELGERAGVARDLYVLGGVIADEGDSATARALLSESLMTRYELGSKRGIQGCLRRLAMVEREQSEPHRLVSLLAAAEALSKTIGSPLISIERDLQEKWLSFARSKLGPEAFSAAWERGATMPIEEAVALALQSPTTPQATSQALQGPPPPVALPSSHRSNLTPREIEVLQLVAAGLTNAGIASHLHLSVNTVRTHLGSIFDKIKVTTRGAAVRYAFEHSLV